MTALRAGVLAAALLLSAETFASAAQPSPPAVVAGQADAEALAMLVIPPDLLVELEVGWGRRRFMAGLEMDPLGKRMMVAEPGMAAKLWSALEPEYRKRGAKRLPGFRQGLGALYAARLTPPEIAAVRTFYATSTGRKIVEAVYRNRLLDPIYDRAAVTGDIDAGRRDIAAAIAGAGAAAPGTFTADDDPAFDAVARTLPLDRLLSVDLEANRFVLDWLNAEEPAFRTRTERILATAAERYLESHPNLPRR